MALDLVSKYSAPVPRYTSYPTAPHFSAAVGPNEYVSWLESLPAGAPVSLYVHIPYCHSLCWYCGCNTKATRQYRPVERYLATLLREIARIGALVPRSNVVKHVHWGGGSPNILSAADIGLLASALRNRFEIARDAEFAIEIDPRLIEPCQITAFAAAGVNRVSVGVQDFDERVQKAIGRLQSFEQTRDAIEGFRRRGVEAINIDLMYGLPHQSTESVLRTIEQVVSLAPQRIAIFGYAHLPARMRQQRLIDGRALPGPRERLEQAETLSAYLLANGYVRIGLDHFARASDPMASGAVRRNFQGYTTDDADILIGLGASSISKLPQGYAQNAVAAADYAWRIEEDGIAVAKGLAFSREDRVRAHVIERLMCDLSVSGKELRNRFGADADGVVADMRVIAARHGDGVVVADGDALRVTEQGRPFVRSICAEFDTYFRPDAGRHASGV
jgi:oxygen-independent coproporphyrinogen-3 oxidase